MVSFRRVLTFSISLILLFTLGLPGYTALAQQPGSRTVRLTLLPDYETGSVGVDGRVEPANLSPQAATLADWGTGEALRAEQTAGSNWHIRGQLPGAAVTAAEDGERYRLTLPPLSLAPGDSLALRLPFASLHLAEITPPPDNLAQLTAPVKPLLPSLRYEAGENGRELRLDISFTPIQKEIDLVITPLIGEMLRDRNDSIRLSGQVTFSNLVDFTEFERHCEESPNSPFFRYRTANLLFTLDYPPAFHFGFLSPFYQFKPTYGLVRSSLSACRYQGGTGQVQAQFSGRIFYISQNEARFPQTISREDVVESHQPYAGFDAAPGEYQLTLGEVVLAPDDLLRVTLPRAAIHSVSPPPARFVYDRVEQTVIEYAGPRRFVLSIRYTPEPQLLLQQAPASGRALLTSLETGLSPLFDRYAGTSQLAWSWGLLLVGALVSLTAPRLSGRLRLVAGYGGWLLLSVALLYGLRGVFGWLLLAAGWYFFGRHLGRDRTGLLEGGLAVSLVLLALGLDARAESLFAVLSTIELELTPLTPLIILLLALALYALVNRREQASLASRPLPELLPVIFFLFTLSIYDVLQKSMPALLLIAIGAAWLLYRLPSAVETEKQQSTLDLQERFALVRQSWLVPAGVALFTIFALQHNLQQTSAVFGPAVGLWGAVLMPLLLFVSVLLALSATALLYIVLYPLLPFAAGYLKAIALGLFLLAVFVLGVGSDDRFVTVLDSLLVGRFIYYASVPLLVGLYFDIKQFQAENKQKPDDGEEEKALTFQKAAGKYLQQVRGLVSAASSLLSLVAPSLYAYLFDQPIVATYFDLLEQLISLSAGGL